MIGVVLPVYAATPEIAQTARESLANWAEHSGPHAHIVVVVNGAPFTWMAADDVVYLPRNLGYSAAVNVGLETAKAAGCDHFVVGSADIFIGPDTIEELMSPGLVSALESPAVVHPECPGPCPFWGGVYAFPTALLEDVGPLPREYTRIGDAAFAARAALLGWEVQRGPAVVEHRHPHAANDHADPAGEVITREKARLATEYGRSICALLAHLSTLDPAARVLLAREARR